ncbi:hypothetical protein JOC93_003244 [Priestia taiwanensis]|nr:hypothetical protein [Priestia taiwanensis]
MSALAYASSAFVTSLYPSAKSPKTGMATVASNAKPLPAATAEAATAPSPTDKAPAPEIADGAKAEAIPSRRLLISFSICFAALTASWIPSLKLSVSGLGIDFLTLS